MKKILSIILAITMVLSSLVFSTTALAEQKTVTVSYCVCDGGMFTLEPTDIEVTADLSDKYAELVGYNDTLDAPSILDATIAAHIAMFGDDFMDYAPLLASSASYTYAAFGEETSALTYRLNGKIADESGMYYNYNTAVYDNDYVEFMFYVDTYMYSDAYTSFGARKIIAGLGKKTVITLTKEVYDSQWNLVTIPAEDVMITVNGYDIGLTDENGQISYVFDEEGSFKLSAYVDLEEDAPIFIPYAEVVVNDFQLEKYIDKEIKEGVKFITDEDTLYSADNAVYFLNLCKSGLATNIDKLNFASAIQSNLIANDGKILSYGAESFGAYGAVIQALELSGYNARDFYGYNLYDALEAMDVNSECNPYYYRYAIEVASEKYAIELCKAYIDKYYTLGSGLNYWGYSCDNTGNFLAAIAKYKDEFGEYVKDAVSVIDSYTTSNGCFYSNTYNDENANSTASALLGMALIGDEEKAFYYYDLLVSNFEATTGIFTYYGENNVAATKDAVVALEAYYDFVYNNNYEHPIHIDKTTITAKATCAKAGSKKFTCVVCGNERTETIKKLTTHKYDAGKITTKPTCTKTGIKTYTCTVCKKTKTETIKATGHSKVIDKAVAPTYAKAGKTEGSHCKTCGKVLVAQKSVKKLTVAKPTNVKISAKSKAFKLSWKKNSKATGYQIQYSTKSNFSSKKTVTIAKKSTVSKTISKLKAKKKYYVRIRAYKTENGKKYYSSWVTKNVTTKK